ncbi:MAG: hypothetical protein GYB67_14385 [Chloroflexi bacterium]|nr:hypothetical protein [Chloroflexota bacterium]
MQRVPSQQAKGELTQAAIADLLHNPTKTVSVEQLKQEYTYVVSDLRSMGILAAGLVVLLVLLATFLPT